MEGDSKNNQQSPLDGDVISEDMPNNSDGLGNGAEAVMGNNPKFRNLAAKTADHTVTVREAAKIFEEANLPVTERTIINWCNPNKRGIVRLDGYFDLNDGKYFITPKSIQQLIENQLLVAKETQQVPFISSENQKNGSEHFVNRTKKRPQLSEEVPMDSDNGSERFGTAGGEETGNGGNNEQVVRELRHQLIDEKILNKGKDYFIEQLQRDRETFVDERRELINQMVLKGERIGQLESELRQLQAPRSSDETNRRKPDGGVNDEE